VCKHRAGRAGSVTEAEIPNSLLRLCNSSNAPAVALDLSAFTIVFDLDGTLVDTAPDLTAATNYALAGAGLAPMTVAELRPFIGYGSRVMLEGGLRHHGVSLDIAEVGRLHARFFEYYGTHLAVGSRPYEELPEVLGRLKGAGARLAVCTNKYEALSKALLRGLALDGLFEVIAGRDTFPMCKPDPGHLTRTIEMAGGYVDRAVMVGDSEVDIATARAARVPSIAVTFGYTPRPVREFAPDVAIDHYREFMPALEQLISKPRGGADRS
jgi:phosphoglycolate phosphatase